MPAIVVQLDFLKTLKPLELGPQILDRDARKCSHAVKLYMLELYQDELMDLLKPRAEKSRGGMSTPEVLSQGVGLK